MARSGPTGRRLQRFDHWGNLRTELIELVGELGRFPTPNDLERRGRYDLMRAIVHNGGSRRVAERLRAESEAAAAVLGAASERG